MAGYVFKGQSPNLLPKLKTRSPYLTNRIQGHQMNEQTRTTFCHQIYKPKCICHTQKNVKRDLRENFKRRHYSDHPAYINPVEPAFPHNKSTMSGTHKVGREKVPAVYNISWDFLTQRLTFFLKSSLLSLHSLAASTFAGDSSLGLESIDMILKTILSTVWTGIQRSLASS